MLQLLPTSESPLMVRDGESRRYRRATPEQILAAARRVIDQRMTRGSSFESPAATREYLRTKLAGYDYEVFSLLTLDLCVASSYVVQSCCFARISAISGS